MLSNEIGEINWDFSRFSEIKELSITKSLISLVKSAGKLVINLKYTLKLFNLFWRKTNLIDLPQFLEHLLLFRSLKFVEFYFEFLIYWKLFFSFTNIEDFKEPWINNFKENEIECFHLSLKLLINSNKFTFKLHQDSFSRFSGKNDWFILEIERTAFILRV